MRASELKRGRHAKRDVNDAAWGGSESYNDVERPCAVVQVIGDLGGLPLNLPKSSLREHGFLQRTKGEHLHAMREALPINRGEIMLLWYCVNQQCSEPSPLAPT